MILVLKTSHHGHSDAMHNPPATLASLKRSLFHFSRSTTRFYRLSHLEIIDIEKVAICSNLRSPNNKNIPVMRISKYGESNAPTLEDLTLQVGNPVKEILLN
ncbi:hypothetical protein Tco_0129389 [Tanacetum coccineum]